MPIPAVGLNLWFSLQGVKHSPNQRWAFHLGRVLHDCWWPERNFSIELLYLVPFLPGFCVSLGHLHVIVFFATGCTKTFLPYFWMQPGKLLAKNCDRDWLGPFQWFHMAWVSGSVLAVIPSVELALNDMGETNCTIHAKVCNCAAVGRSCSRANTKGDSPLLVLGVLWMTMV